jgi:LacI family gluconate utilization system Gnt-I transcriptional repressor
VEATGYIPNRLAGGLKSQRSMTVAGLVPVVSVPQFLPTIRVLTETLHEHGYQLILGQTGYDRAREDSLVDAMLARRPDAVVCAGLIHSPRARAQLRRQGIPVVETWDLGGEPVDMAVGFSHPAAGAAVARFFRERGFSRVAIATADDDRALQREHGFRAEWGADVAVARVPAPSSLALGRQALAELLAREPKVQAVMCSSDGLAQGVLVEAAARGLQVPRDLAVCGFGDADFAAHLVPSLTTVQVDGERIGRIAAELLLARCGGQPVPHPIVDAGFRIVERESTSLTP